jgi:RimJ/RimL family protein N-acetyltransferase
MDAFRGRVTDDFSSQTIDEFVPEMIELASRVETYGVWRGEGSDEELGGMVWIERASPYLAIAHLLFKRSFWGRETTQASLWQIFDRVFASGIGKITSSVFADNYQVLSLVKALGAKEEGRLREHTLRYGGKPADSIPVGLLKRDFYEQSGGSGSGNVGDIGNRELVRLPEVVDHHHDANILGGAERDPVGRGGDAPERDEQPGQPPAIGDSGVKPG